MIFMENDRPTNVIYKYRLDHMQFSILIKEIERERENDVNIKCQNLNQIIFFSSCYHIVEQYERD